MKYLLLWLSLCSAQSNDTLAKIQQQLQDGINNATAKKNEEESNQSTNSDSNGNDSGNSQGNTASRFGYVESAAITSLMLLMT